MKKIIISLISLIGIITVSCNLFDFSNYKFEEVLYEKESYQNCEDDCTEISLNYVFSAKNDEFSKKFNKTIQNRIFKILQVDTNKELSMKNLDSIVEDYLSDYKKINNQQLGIEPYELTLVDTVLFHNKNVVSLKSEVFSYNGVAGSYPTTDYINFKSNGDIYKNEELFTNIDTIKQIVKKYYIKSINEQDLELYNDTKQQFSLPENIGFQKDTIVFHYNPYEIPPYTNPTIIKIPVEKVKKWMSFKL